MRQRADVNGHHNVVVQILGSDNRVDLNRPYLVLVPWERKLRSAEAVGAADLLTPYRRVTELQGRDQEMEQHLAWAQSDRPIAIRLITGGAGSGKTRIAIELMRALSALPDSGWANYEDDWRHLRDSCLANEPVEKPPHYD